MDYLIKYRPKERVDKWGVFVQREEGDRFLQAFSTKDAADEWVLTQQGDEGAAHKKQKLDKVDKAAADSFPASDPPGWSGAIAAR